MKEFVEQFQYRVFRRASWRSSIGGIGGAKIEWQGCIGWNLMDLNQCRRSRMSKSWRSQSVSNRSCLQKLTKLLHWIHTASVVMKLSWLITFVASQLFIALVALMLGSGTEIINIILLTHGRVVSVLHCLLVPRAQRG
jgi:hypothetical protein